MTGGSGVLGEMSEEPQALQRLLDREGKRAARLARAFAARRPSFVLIAARGTSDNAARYALYAMGICARLPVALAAPSLFTVYGRSPRVKDALVIGISQSGRSPDVCETVADARRQGAATLAIVNDESSPLAGAAAEVLPLHAGVEVSVAATKTYTNELLAAAIVALHLGPPRSERAFLLRLPGVVSLALARGREAAEAALPVAAAGRAVVLARGLHFASAHEAALKLKELALVLAEPMSAADFRHGPVALSDVSLPTVIVSPSGGAASGPLARLGRLLERRGSPVVRIGGRGRGAIPVPFAPELLSPIAVAPALQLLAVQASLARGLDPDRPRGLAKVTRTR